LLAASIRASSPTTIPTRLRTRPSWVLRGSPTEPRRGCARATLLMSSRFLPRSTSDTRSRALPAMRPPWRRRPPSLDPQLRGFGRGTASPRGRGGWLLLAPEPPQLQEANHDDHQTVG